MLAQNLYVDCDVTHESSLQTIVVKNDPCEVCAMWTLPGLERHRKEVLMLDVSLLRHYLERGKRALSLLQTGLGLN